MPSIIALMGMEHLPPIAPSPARTGRLGRPGPVACPRLPVCLPVRFLHDVHTVARAICSSEVDDLATDFLEIDDELDDTDFE